MSDALHRVVNMADQTPTWFNWLAIVGSAAISFLQPMASLVAIVWGCIQIYSWWEKRCKRKGS